MPDTHVFSGVTPEVLDRLGGADDGSGNYTLELDPDRRGGKLTRRSGMGEVVVRFDHDVERAELTVTIVKKPMLLPAVALWAEMTFALQSASGKA